MRLTPRSPAVLFAATMLFLSACAKDAPQAIEEPPVAREDKPSAPSLIPAIPALPAATDSAPSAPAASAAAAESGEKAPVAEPLAAAATATPPIGAAVLAQAPTEPAASASAAPVAAEAPKVENVTSSAQGSDGFSVWVQGPGKQKVGQPGQVEVVLVAKGDFHCNDNYPYKFKLGAPSAGVSYPQPVVRREGLSLTPGRAVMRIPFVPSEVGEAKIAGRFSFSVCTSAQCVVDSRDLAVSVMVE